MTFDMTVEQSLGGLSFEYHAWGFEIIMDEALTNQIAGGGNVTAGLAGMIAAGLPAIPVVGPVLGALAAGIAGAIVLKAGEMQLVDRGYGVYWPFSIPQLMGIVALGVPTGALGLIPAIYAIIHPLPNGKLGKAELPPNGTRVVRGTNGQDTIYLVLDRVLRGIVSPEAYNNLFKDWKNLVRLQSLDGFEVGPAINKDNTFLIATAKDAPKEYKGAAYLCIDGQRRHIANPNTFSKYNFDWGKVATPAWPEIAKIPEGGVLN
jgi:hypothetical protein